MHAKNRKTDHSSCFTALAYIRLCLQLLSLRMKKESTRKHTILNYVCDGETPRHKFNNINMIAQYIVVCQANFKKFFLHMVVRMTICIENVLIAHRHLIVCNILLMRIEYVFCA